MDDRTLARFMGRFFVLPDECWYWTGNVSEAGYGMFHFEGQNRPAHRVSYMHFVGPIPDGLHIDHLCHTWDWACPGGDDDHHRRCVNWRHLEAVEPRINSLRSVRSRATHCINGHEFTPENTYIATDGSRECRLCRAERSAAWVAEHHPGVRHGTETHCPKGHLYEGDNLIITPYGGRACRQCKRDWSRRQMRAKRALARGYRPLLPGSDICPVGHDLTDEDSFFVHEGQLVCLICMTPDGSRSSKGAAALIAAANSALISGGMLF